MSSERPQAEGLPEGGAGPKANGQQADGTPRRQFVKFSFFKIDPAWRRLPTNDREQGKREICQVVDSFGSRMLIGSYTLVGIRGDSDFEGGWPAPIRSFSEGRAATWRGGRALIVVVEAPPSGAWAGPTSGVE